MRPEDQIMWDEQQMQLSVDFSSCQIDPAPFQLIEKTSLLKVHSLFSLVRVNLAYVTAVGKLVGVIGLKELKKAVEDANSGKLPLSENDYKNKIEIINRKMSVSDIRDSLKSFKDSKV